MPTNDYIRWFSDIRLGDVALVGGKNASLGQLYSTLSKEGVLVPNGLRHAKPTAMPSPPTPGSGCTSSLTSSTSGASTFSPSAPPRRASSSTTRPTAMNCGKSLSALIGNWRPTTARTSPLPSAAPPRRRIYTRRALPGSTTAFSTCAAPTHCSRPAVAASLRSSPTARSPTASTMDSITSRSASRSA